MFITIPHYPPNAQGAPDTSRHEEIAVRADCIMLMSSIRVPSRVAGMDKPATLIGLSIPGASLVSPMMIAEIEAQIYLATQTTLARPN